MTNTPAHPLLIAAFLFLASALSAVVAEEKQQQSMDGYIVFGQSNANGRSYSSELSDEELHQSFDGEGSPFLYAYRERSYKDGNHPEDVPLGSMQPDSRNRIGVEVTLGRRLSTHSPRPALLVKFCSGGTSIKNFLPEENNLFQPMVKYLKAKQEEARKLGYRVRWKAAFVVTGESDSLKEKALLFSDRFLAVQSALERDLDLEPLPMVYSLLRGDWVDTSASNYSRLNTSAVLINDAMTALAKIDPSVRVTPSNSDLKTRFENGDSKRDGIHYSANSYARLGIRLYKTTFPNARP